MGRAIVNWHFDFISGKFEMEILVRKMVGTYAHDGVDLVILPILHVVREHLAHFLQLEFSCAAEPYQELVCHPRIVSSVLKIDGDPIFECPERYYLQVI